MQPPQPLNRFSGFGPIYMSIIALLAVAHSYRHASHEDGNWHLWMLMVLLQLPVMVYFALTSRHELRTARPILIAQGFMWLAVLMAGGLQTHWA